MIIRQDRWFIVNRYMYVENSLGRMIKWIHAGFAADPRDRGMNEIEIYGIRV